MNELNVWDIIDLLSDYKLVGTTWVFKVKKDHLHEDVEYKAHLCAQGFTQTPGVDFEKTYTPSGHLSSLRALIVHSCANGLDLHQVDVKSGFLNAPLIEAVYLSIPQGLEINRHWLQSVGFNACKLDPCVLYRKEPDALWIYVHVDNMAIFGTNIQLFKEQINRELNIKDIGPADLLMQHCKTVRTPLFPNEYLSPETNDKRRIFKALGINFRSAVSSINYLSTATQPDLSHACNPGLIAFTNADWGNFQITQHSTSGYLEKLHGCLIFWKTRKQPLLSISTAKAEYKSLCDLMSELLWFCQWCQEADIFHFNSAITKWEDKQSCIETANGNCNINTKRMKHVEIQLHFIKEAIKKQLMELRYAPTLDMLADFLTKAVPKTIFQRALMVLGVLILGSWGVLKNIAMKS
ncbi:hypothetical protein O181_060678 [Austropuccinia psidii MF-1]|uniref:Reverse transcriptase Ty1/copia-type domain-containing protein n=1 Tax=Austropuccinia psidii MF-1 TaxID=1389203 RepID=A0A9Q3EL95_9BASI|nr:hypothetical protein [Austropuccinia psidii MF-1]